MKTEEIIKEDLHPLLHYILLFTKEITMQT